MQLLKEGAKAWGLDLSIDQLRAFRLYYEELLAWNQRLSLTAITGVEQVQVRHFLDSLSCLTVLDGVSPRGKSLRVIDVGTGAGFPGMALKILRPDWRLTLVDSVGKKVSFVEHMAEALELEEVEALWARAEVLGQDATHREQYDAAVGRAVAALPVLAEYLLPLCRVGGRMVALKGPNVEPELEDARTAISLLGGRVAELRRVDVPGLNEKRYLVVVDKVVTTPPSYPRRPGMPAKRPLA